MITAIRVYSAIIIVMTSTRRFWYWANICHFGGCQITVSMSRVPSFWPSMPYLSTGEYNNPQYFVKGKSLLMWGTKCDSIFKSKSSKELCIEIVLLYFFSILLFQILWLYSALVYQTLQNMSLMTVSFCKRR